MKRLNGLLLSTLLLMNLVSPYTAVYAEDTGSGTTTVETTGPTESTDTADTGTSTDSSDNGTDTGTDAADTETTGTTDGATTETGTTDTTGSDQEPASGDVENTDGTQTDSADTNATADDAAALNAEPEETEVTTDSQTYTAETASHIQVTAVADAGAFAQDVMMKVSDLTSADAMAIAQQVLGAGTVDATGVNITFYDADNAEVEPVKTDAVHVTISFPSDATVDGDEFHLLHQDDSGTVSEVTDAEADGSGAEFDAASFSNYVVGSISKGSSTDVNGVFSHAQVAIAAWHQGKYSYDDTSDTNLVPLKTITSGETVTLQNFRNASASVRGNLLVFAKAEDGYLLTGLGSKNSLGDFYPIEGLNGNFTGYPRIEKYMGFSNLIRRAYQEGYQIVFGFSRQPGDSAGISFTIDTEPVGIGVTAKSDKENVVPGDTIVVTTTITPTQTMTKGIGVSLTEDAAYAEIDGRKIAISNLTDDGNGTWTGTFSYTVTAEDCADQKVSFTVHAGLTYSYAFPNTQLTTSVIENGSASVTVPIESQTILIQGKSDTVTYDGSPHQLSGFMVNDNEVKAGTDSVNITIRGITYTVTGLSSITNQAASGTAAGTYENSVSASQGAVKVYSPQGKDISSAFVIHFASGTLSIDPRKVNLKSESESKEYDGTALTKDAVTVSGDGFVDGEVSSVKATGSITDVGSAENEIVITMNNGFTLDNYDITKDTGTLTITKNTSDITVTASDASKTYDGKALTSTAATWTGLPQGMKAVIETDGTITNVGQVTNSITSVVIVDSDGKDVTDRFTNISKVAGKLIIMQRKVKLTSENKRKEFDGTALTAPSVTVGDDGFVDGEVSDLKATGTITKVGSVTNTITYTKNAGFLDQNYLIEKDEGTLVVALNSKVITVTAADAKKTYDGQPLTSDGYSVDGLPNGLTLTATTAGSITDVGTADNTIASVQILDSDNNDVTDQFSGVVKETGTLAVLPRSVTLTSKNDEKVYDGSALTAPEVTISGDGFVNGEVSNVRATGSITDVGSAVNTITFDKSTGYKDANYTIVKNEGTLTVRENSSEIVITPHNASKVYDGTALTESAADVVGLPSGLTISVITSGSITNAGSTENKVASYTITDSSGTDVTKSFTNIKVNQGTLTVEKRKVALTSGTVTREYDGSALTSSDVTISGDGFVDGEVSNIRATGSVTRVGSVENTIAYETGTNFKADNYEIELDPGTLNVTKSSDTFIILVETDSKIYDGKPLNATYSVYAPHGFDEYTGTAVLKKSGFSVASFITGVSSSVSITDAGSIEVEASSYSFKDKAGNDVTDCFSDPLLIDGRLTVYPRLLALRSESKEKEYDGTALTSAAVTVDGDGFADGESFEIQATGSQTDVGSSSNTILSLPEKKGKFKLSNYSVVLLPGTLTVTQNTSPIVVTASSQVKIYDGTPLTSQMHSVSGLPDGFTADVALSGSVTNVSDNAEGNHTVSSVRILRDGKDVTSNFSNVTAQNGTLRVIPASLGMDTVADLVYNGQEQQPAPVIFYGSALTDTSIKAPVPTDEDYTLSYEVVSGSLKDAGSTVRVSATGKGNYAGSVAQEYHILPRELSVVTDSASKDFDGTALTAGGSLSGAVESDGLRLVMTGSQTSAGSSDNTYVIDYGSALATNYEIESESLGTLTVFALAPKEAGRTCQDDGYGDGYVWNEAAQACVLESAPPVSSRKLSPQTGVTGSGE